MTESTQSNFEFESRPVTEGAEIYQNFATYEGQEIAVQCENGQWRCTHNANAAAMSLFDDEYDDGDRKYRAAIREKVAELATREHADSFGKVESESPANRGVESVAALADQCELHSAHPDFADQILSLGRCCLKPNGKLREYGIRMNTTRNRAGKQVAYLNLYVRRANAFNKGDGRWEFANLKGSSNTFAYMSAAGLWNWADPVISWIDYYSADDDGVERTKDEIRNIVGERQVMFHVLNMFGG